MGENGREGEWVNFREEYIRMLEEAGVSDLEGYLFEELK